MKRTLPDSLWAATANSAVATQALTSDITCDVAVVGAGFTGLRAALELSQQGVNVAIVDAGDIGWGASGRNGGQVNPIAHESPEAIKNQWTQLLGKNKAEEYAQRFTQVYAHSADEVFELIKKHNIDCDAEQNGWIRSVHGNAAMPAFEDMFKGWTNAGADLEWLDQSQVECLSGSRAYHQGWLAKRGGSVQPLSYVRGLANAAKHAGADIYSHTPVETLQQQGSRWKLNTASGSVVADQVLLCTNGYSDDLCPGLKESVVPVVSIQAATQVLTKTQSAAILPNRLTFADTRRVVFYFKKTAENRLVFGSAGIAGELPDMSDRKRILNGLRTVFPQFPELDIDYIWGGRIAVTQDHLPHIHQPFSGVYAGLGYNGRGVAMSTVMGRVLADVVMGKSHDELPLPVTQIKRYPFHRFHRAGIRLAVPWKEFWDKREAKST